MDARPDPQLKLDGAPRIRLAEGLAAAASKHSDRLAINGCGIRLSHREFAKRANDFACELALHGVEPGETILFECARDPSIAWGIAGAIQLGATFVLVDAALPPARRRDCLVASGASVVVRSMGARLAAVPSEHRRDTTPRAASYLMFTSGSSGLLPKTVAAGDSPLVHFLNWYSRRFRIASDDRVAMLSGLGHDPLLRDILVPLWTGASIHVPEIPLLDGRGLRGWLARLRVSILHATPQLASLIFNSDDPSPLPDLRLVVLGGAPLHRTLVTTIGGCAPHAVIVNAYGATETPQIAAYHVLSTEPRSDVEGEIVPVGSGIEDVQLLVLSAGDRLAALGETGEICVRSPYLALGYVDDPEETARRFAPNPLSGDAGDQLYRTGDQGHYLPNGEVMLSGRTDRQVKVGGHRLELAEIERAARGCVGVEEAFATWLGERDQPDLVCAVIARDTPSIGPMLQAYLRQVLPAHANPVRILQLDTWPLTANAKIDEPRLRVLASQLAGTQVDQGRDEVEAQVLRLWDASLGVTAEPGSDFLSLGGSSLAALRIAGELTRNLGVIVSPVDVLERRTAGALARHVADLLAQARLEEADLAAELRQLLEADPASIASLAGTFRRTIA